MADPQQEAVHTDSEADHLKSEPKAFELPVALGSFPGSRIQLWGGLGPDKEDNSWGQEHTKAFNFTSDAPRGVYWTRTKDYRGQTVWPPSVIQVVLDQKSEPLANLNLHGTPDSGTNLSPDVVNRLSLVEYISLKTSQYFSDLVRSQQLPAAIANKLIGRFRLDIQKLDLDFNNADEVNKFVREFDKSFGETLNRLIQTCIRRDRDAQLVSEREQSWAFSLQGATFASSQTASGQTPGQPPGSGGSAGPGAAGPTGGSPSGPPSGGGAAPGSGGSAAPGGPSPTGSQPGGGASGAGTPGGASQPAPQAGGGQGQTPQPTQTGGGTGSGTGGPSAGGATQPPQQAGAGPGLVKGPDPVKPPKAEQFWLPGGTVMTIETEPAGNFGERLGGKITIRHFREADAGMTATDRMQFLREKDGKFEALKVPDLEISFNIDGNDLSNEERIKRIAYLKDRMNVAKGQNPDPLMPGFHRGIAGKLIASTLVDLDDGTRTGVPAESRLWRNDNDPLFDKLTNTANHLQEKLRQEGKKDLKLKVTKQLITVDGERVERGEISDFVKPKANQDPLAYNRELLTSMAHRALYGQFEYRISIYEGDELLKKNWNELVYFHDDDGEYLYIMGDLQVPYKPRPEDTDMDMHKIGKHTMSLDPEMKKTMMFIWLGDLKTPRWSVWNELNSFIPALAHDHKYVKRHDQMFSHSRLVDFVWTAADSKRPTRDNHPKSEGVAGIFRGHLKGVNWPRCKIAHVRQCIIEDSFVVWACDRSTFSDCKVKGRTVMGFYSEDPNRTAAESVTILRGEWGPNFGERLWSWVRPWTWGSYRRPELYGEIASGSLSATTFNVNLLAMKKFDITLEYKSKGEVRHAFAGSLIDDALIKDKRLKELHIPLADFGFVGTLIFQYHRAGMITLPEVMQLLAQARSQVFVEQSDGEEKGGAARTGSHRHATRRLTLNARDNARHLDLMAYQGEFEKRNRLRYLTTMVGRTIPGVRSLLGKMSPFNEYQLGFDRCGFAIFMDHRGEEVERVEGNHMLGMQLYMNVVRDLSTPHVKTRDEALPVNELNTDLWGTGISNISDRYRPLMDPALQINLGQQRNRRRPNAT